MRFVWAILFTLMAGPAFAQAPPTNLRTIAAGTFGLMWDYTDTVTGFNVRAGNAEGVVKLLAVVPGTAMLNGQVAVIDVPSPGPGTWNLIVTAFAGTSESAGSNQVRIFVPDPPPVEPCTYIPNGATEAETRPPGYLLIGRIVYDNNSTQSKTDAALRVQKFVKWGWLLTPWPEIDPVDGKYVLRVRAWCRFVSGA